MWWKVASVVGGSGVALGAFGAHALDGTITDPHLLEVWDTAARYHLIHALAILGVAAHPGRPFMAGALFTAGVAVFCGSLYLMTLSGLTWLGAITPVGGVCFIAGWTVLGLTPSKATHA